MTVTCAGSQACHHFDSTSNRMATDISLACLVGLTGTVYGRLQDSGFFFDPVQREVEQQVMPWLKEETQKIVARQATARCVTTHHPSATHTLFLCFSTSVKVEVRLGEVELG